MVVGVFVVVIALKRIMSLASICGAVAFPVSALIFYFGQWDVFAYAAVMSGFVIWLHRDNIKRLMTGTELPIGAKKKSGKGSAT